MQPKLIRLASLLAVAFAIAVAVLAMVWQSGAEQRALGAMPADSRAKIYASGLEEFEHMCQPPTPAFRDFCLRQASFLLQFPECKDRCAAAVESVLRRPVRPR